MKLPDKLLITAALIGITIGITASIGATTKPRAQPTQADYLPLPITATQPAAGQFIPVPRSAFRWHTALVTAYTAGPKSTGKRLGDPGYGITFSGLPVHVGVVAVDPTIIPLGSILFVPGYGLSVALDTGSAIKGWHVDVFLPRTPAAQAWGRQLLHVGVLQPQMLNHKE